MSVDVTQEQLMQVLYQQAVLLFGRERAESLEPQLKERAGYLRKRGQSTVCPLIEIDHFVGVGVDA